MDDLNIFNNLDELSDDEYLYFCNDVCESYSKNTFKKDSLHFIISNNKFYFDEIIRNLSNSSKVIQLSSAWCILVILLTLKNEEDKYKEFIDSLFQLENYTLLPSYYFLKLRQERRFECKHPILGEYYTPSVEILSYYLNKLNELLIKISQTSINDLFSFNSLRVFYNLIKTDKYKMNVEYYNTYTKILNIMINNLYLFKNESNYQYISTKIIKCYYRIIINYYSNSSNAGSINIPINDVLNTLNSSFFVDKSSKLYYYVVYYYTQLIITTTTDEDADNNLFSKITYLFPLADEVSFLKMVLYEYINNDQLMYDVLFIDLLFYMKFNEIYDKEVMNSFSPIVMFNLYLAIFEYEVDDIFQIINSEESQIFLLFLLKFLKWCFSNKQTILQSDISLLYNRIISCLNELNVKYDLKNNGFSVLEKWINKNCL